MQTYLKSRPVWIQLILFMGMAFGIFLIFSLIGMFILSQMTGIGIQELPGLLRSETVRPEGIVYLRGMLLVQFLGLFTIPSLLFAYFSDPQPGQYLGLHAPHKASYWLLGIAAMAVAYPLVEFSGWLNQQMAFGAGAQQMLKNMEEEAARQIRFMIDRRTPTELILNLIFISLFAGIGEELFFRGVLQRLFIKATRSPWLGILIAAMLFSGFHMQFFGFIPRMLLGVLLGVIYWYSGSIWPAIIAHFLYDAIIIVILYFHPELANQPETTVMRPMALGLSAAISVVLTWLIVKQMIKQSSSRFEEVYKDDQPPTDTFSF